MPKITGPWTYRTPTVTIDYPAGEHDVTAEVAEAWPGEAVADEPTEPSILDLSLPDLAEEVERITDIEMIDAMLASETLGKTRVGALAVLNARRAELAADG